MRSGLGTANILIGGVQEPCGGNPCFGAVRGDHESADHDRRGHAACDDCRLAQDFPARPIRMIVPLTPGSGADIAGRIIGSADRDWKQPVIVENRPGAGGQIGTRRWSRPTPTATRCWCSRPRTRPTPAIYKSLPYDPLKDLVDVAPSADALCHGQRPTARTSRSSADRRRQGQAGRLPFASAGIGTSTHLAAEYIVDLAG